MIVSQQERHGRQRIMHGVPKYLVESSLYLGITCWLPLSHLQVPDVGLQLHGHLLRDWLLRDTLQLLRLQIINL